MPAHNGFAHQDYTSQQPNTPYALVRPAGLELSGSAAFIATMSAVGRRLRDHQVAAIYLVHGTLAGTDSLGFFRELRRVMPELADQLGRRHKSFVDALLGQTANFTEQYASRFEQAVNSNGAPTIPVRRFFWSSENHHYGRAAAAVRLLDELQSLHLQPNQRVLLWGHSHAGNVFALLSNLLGGTPDAMKRFFRAVRPISKSAPDMNWREIENQLTTGTLRLTPQCVDLVTLGTPIRYGWETAGMGHLLHFVNHRPAASKPRYLVPFPLTVEQIVSAECGDFFQQFFIAGTNFPPNLLAWGLWKVELRLARLLQRGQPRRKLWERLKCGQRVAADGTCLLVDYGAADAAAAQSVLGHGVYTRDDWLAFHAQAVTQKFYPEQEA